MKYSGIWLLKMKESFQQSESPQTFKRLLSYFLLRFVLLFDGSKMLRWNLSSASSFKTLLNEHFSNL